MKIAMGRQIETPSHVRWKLEIVVVSEGQFTEICACYKEQLCWTLSRFLCGFLIFQTLAPFATPDSVTSKLRKATLLAAD